MKTSRGLFNLWLLSAILLLTMFTAVADAATVSGTVTNNSGTAGRVYLSGQWSGGGNAGWGVSVQVGTTGTTAYTIRGVQDGTYTVKAFLDTQDIGMQHANDPVGSSAQFSVTGGAPATNVSVTLNSPPAVGIQPPVGVSVVSGDGGVLVTWDAAKDANGSVIATANKVYWSISPNPGPANITGGGSSPVISSNDNNAYIRAFTNGTALYFAVTAMLNGVESAPVNANSGALVTVNPPAGGVIVSGTVTTTGVTLGAATPLYIAMGGNNGPPSHIARIATPSASQAFSIPGIQPGDYGIYAILDMNNNGIIDLGDITNTSGNGVQVTVAGTNVSGVNVPVVAGDVQITVRTNHSQQNTSDWYGLNLEVGSQVKRPVNVAVSGPQLATPVDLALSNWGGFEAWPNVANRPTMLPVPDTYSFTIFYSDLTNTGANPLTAPITGIVDSFVAPTSPVGYVPFPVSSPTSFSWSAPLSPPSPYTYSFWLNVPNFDDNNFYSLPSTTAFVTYSYGFVENSEYQWNISVRDSLGNSAQNQVNFTPTSSPAISSFTPSSGIPGTQVTITGFNFGTSTANNQVSFNGTLATIISASTTSLLVTVPNGASTGQIVINNLTTGKASGSLYSSQFTVITPTPPTTFANPAGGTQTGPINVFLTTNEPATIYYTTNGADPTTSSAFFTDNVGNVAKGPIAISSSTTLKYFARDLQGSSETIKQEVYFYGTPTTLTLGLGGISSIVYGDMVTATATITPGAGPTGSVQFFVDGIVNGPPVPLSGALATKVISGLQVTGSPHAIAAVYSGDATYASSSNSATMTVTKANQTTQVDVAVPAVDIVYAQSGVTVTASGGNGSGAYVYDAGLSTACSVDSATGALTITSGTGNCAITATKLGDANYNASAASSAASITIAKADQIITVTMHAPPTAAYGATFTVAATADSGLTVTYSSGDPAVCTNVGAVFTMISSTNVCNVQYDQAGNTNFTAAITLTENTTATTASQAAVTVTAPLTAYYGQTGLAAVATGGSGTGVYSYNAGLSTACSVNAITGALTITSGTGTCSITALRLADINYNVSAASVPANVTIIKATQTITITTPAPATAAFNSTFTVAATAPAGSVTYSSGSPTVCTNVGPLFTIVSGTGTCVVQYDQSGNPNYAAAQMTSNTTASKLAQTITVTTPAPAAAAFNSTFTVAATAPAGSVTYSSGSPTVCTNSGAIFTMVSGTGTCAVQYNQTGSVNYNAAVQVILNTAASKLAQSITVTTPAPGSAAVNSSFTVAATAPAGAVTYSSGSPGVCTNSGATFTMVAPTGICVVRYDQSGSANYTAALQVTSNTNATNLAQTITVTTAAPATAAFNSTFTVAATAPAGAVTYSSGSPTVCTNSGAIFTMVSGTGSCVAQYNQVGNANYASAPQVTSSTTASKLAQTITVTTPAPASAAVNSSFTVAATAPAGSVTYTSGSPSVCTNSGAILTVVSGTGICVVQYNQAGNANYAAATQVTSNTTASKIAQTITVTTPAPATAAYNSTFTVAATATAGTVTYSSGSPTVCTNSGAVFTMVSGTGACVVQYGQAGNADYAAAPQVTSNTTASKIAQIITVTIPAPATAAYNSTFTVAATAPAAAVTYSSGSPTVCTNSGAVFTMVSGTGTCVVQYNQAGNVNYAAAPQVTSNTTATKLAQTITFTTAVPATAVYNSTFTVAATATAGAVTYSSGSPSVCTNSGAVFTMVSGTGTCVVQYNQTGNASYTAAPQRTSNTTAAKAAATVTITNLTQTADGTARAVTTTTNPAGLAVNVTYNSSSSAPIPAGTYAVVATIVDANYQGSASATLTVLDFGDITGGTGQSDGVIDIFDAYNYLLISLHLAPQPAYTDNLLLAPIVSGKPTAVAGSRQVNVLDVRAMLEKVAGLW